MTILRRKLLREIRGSQGLLLLIASIIAVGVTCFVSLQSAYHNLDQAKRRYYRQCRMADFWIDLKKAPLSDVHSLISIPGVTEIQPRIQFQATVDLDGSEKPINGQVLSLPDRRTSVINDILVRQGSYFSDRRRNEVIVSEKFARTHSLYPGSQLHLLLNNRRQELFVVGTAIGSEFTYLIGAGSLVPDPEHFGVFFIKQSFAEEVFDFQGAANQVVGRLAPDAQDRVAEVMRQAEERLDDDGVFSTTALEFQVSNQFLSNEIAGLGAFATVVPVIFLAVAALVLNILINRMARRQRIVVGTLKALGYNNRQIFLHFMLYGLSVGLVGGLLGSVLGYLSAAGLTEVYQQYFEFPDLRNGLYWYTHGIGIAVSLVCSLAGGIHGSLSMLRLQPAEAMRPEPPRRGRTIWLEWLLGDLWNALGSGWRMALRALFRHRFRTVSGVFAAMMGAGLLACGFMMIEAQFFLIDFQFHDLARSDIDLVFQDECGEPALDEVRGMPGVDYAEPTLNVACTFVNGPYRRKGAVTGIVEDARLTVPYDIQQRRIEVPDSGLILTKRLADILHVKSGDRLRLIPVKGERRPVDVVVARIADSYLGLTAHAEIHHLARLVGESSALNGVQLVTDRDPRHLRQLYQRLKQTPGIASVQARSEMIETLMKMAVEQQFIFVGLITAFSGIIFFGSIVNASLVNLAERQREVATFRAIGYGQWRIGTIFLRESLLTNLTGTLFGLPVGYFLTWLTAESYNNDLLRLPVVSAPWVWMSTLALAIAFILAAHAVVQWTLYRMDYLEALKVKE